ncbi:hypothetical protein ACFW04_002696 [Cataglyphis niger]
MKILHIILLIAVAIIMISDVMAEESSNKETSSKANPLGLKFSTIRRLKNLWQHVLDEILIAWLNIVFNVGWEETYDYLFGIYGMQPIPYFPIP